MSDIDEDELLDTTDGRDEDEEPDLSNDQVVTKYKLAAEITNKALNKLVTSVVPGASILELCRVGDALIEKETAGVFNKKNESGEKVEKGIAFPTCISVNEVVCHCSPLPDNDRTIQDGDLVKIDLGTHIDGFVATTAHTMVAGLKDGEKIQGRVANVIAAADHGAEAAMRLIKPGKKNTDVAAVLATIAESYGCNVVEGVLSHQMKRFIIDGNKVVLNKPSSEYKAEEFTFQENEVYAVDVVMSTGDGKPRVLDEKQTTVYKRALGQEYHLRMKASRAVYTEISRKFPTMPFTIRALEDTKAKFGIVECVNHDLLHAYSVLHEKSGELVAHFKYTVLLMPNGSDKITGAPHQPYETEKAIEDSEIRTLLQTSLKPKKKSKKKKTKKTDDDKVDGGDGEM